MTMKSEERKRGEWHTLIYIDRIRMKNWVDSPTYVRLHFCSCPPLHVSISHTVRLFERSFWDILGANFVGTRNTVVNMCPVRPR